MVKSRSIFNDPEAEINRLGVLIKQDIQMMNNRLDALDVKDTLNSQPLNVSMFVIAVASGGQSSGQWGTEQQQPPHSHHTLTPTPPQNVKALQQRRGQFAWSA